MPKDGVVRVLWAGAGASVQGFPPGEYRLECVSPVSRALDRIEAAQAKSDPYAVSFLGWGEDRFGLQQVGDLLRVNPDLFLVLEGEEKKLPTVQSLGGWASPERCLTVARPVSPFVRGTLAEHLGTRWLQEARERERLSLLENEARANRARRKRDEARFHVLYGIVEKLHGARNEEAALGIALGEMSRFLGARTSSLMLLEDPGHLRVLEAVGPHRERILGIEVPLEKSRISRYALEEREPILVEDMQENERFRESEETRRFRARSILSVPLFADGHPLGVLNFGGDARETAFTEHDRDLVVTLGRQVAVALEKVRLLEGLRQTVAESIRALAGAIEAKDPYTRGHSDRVTHYSRRIAESLGLERRDLDVVVRAAILHDVGKIGVPGAVLNKPSRLTDDEFRLIKRHPEVGVEIVREIGAMAETLEIIRTHHERIDGKGYPTGIPGPSIPVGARILAVADTYDAMTSDRPYRQGLPDEVAFDEIQRCSGTQFDPEVARIFLDGVTEWPDLAPVLPKAAGD